MFVHEVVIVALSYLTLVATALASRRLVRDSEIRHHMQRRIYLARRSLLVAVSVGQLVCTALASVLGVAFLQLGYVLGWGFFAFAGLPMVFLATTVHVAKIPFSYPDDL